MTHPLKSVLAELPAKPGIYFFKNARGETIYIGKARSLVDRIKSYFQPSDDPKIRNILAETTRLDYLLTGSEREAAFLENNFVQQTQPKFNLRLKDDKSFPYLRLTIQDSVPGIYFSRKVAADGARYFGPFSPAREARKTIRILTKSFRLRTCEDPVFRKRKRPCLEYDLGLCSAPCTALIPASEYRTAVRNAVLFLEGRTEELAAALGETMERAAGEQRFEDAARARDILRTLEQLRHQPRMISVRLEDQDIIGLAQGGAVRAIHVFHMRGGKVRESRDFSFEEEASAAGGDVLRDFLRTFYRDRPLPEKILVPFLPAEADLLKSELRKIAGRKVALLIPRRDRGRTLLELASKNAEILLRRTLGGQASLEELKAILGLRVLPVRIEGFDVSNTQGLETVASMITFLNGRPWPDGYRRYRIKTVQGANDPAAMSEAIQRRYARILKEERPLPDLVVVDGGKPQLQAAVSVLGRLGLSDLPVASLAKREEIIFTPDRPEGLRLARTSAALKLVQYLRDEAHRFAVTYHRQRRSKRSLA